MDENFHDIFFRPADKNFPIRLLQPLKIIKKSLFNQNKVIGTQFALYVFRERREVSRNKRVV